MNDGSLTLHDAASLATLSRDAMLALLRERLRPLDQVAVPDDWRDGSVRTDTPRARLPWHPETSKFAAVLVPLVDRPQGWQVLLTERATHLKNHAGQISFPGGRIEPNDDGPVAAALRETLEEIGLPATHVQPLGRLPDHLIVSGYRVTPIVARVTPGFALQLDSTEVARSFEVPLNFLLDERNHTPRTRRFEDRDYDFIDMPYGEYNIWGATAGMLMTLYRVLRGDDR